SVMGIVRWSTTMRMASFLLGAGSIASLYSIPCQLHPPAPPIPGPSRRGCRAPSPRGPRSSGGRASLAWNIPHSIEFLRNAPTGCSHAGAGAGPACMDDLVVAHRTADVESTAPLDFLW